MANRKDESEEEVPTKQEIVNFILGWQQKPVSPTLGPNQITTAVLMEITGFGYDWAKNRLKEMFEAGLCERERVYLREGSIYVYRFPDELPEFSSQSHNSKVE